MEPPSCVLCLTPALTLAEANRFDLEDEQPIFMTIGKRRLCAKCAGVVMDVYEGRLPSAMPDTSGRKSIPSEIRWEVWERDDFTCRRCGSRRNLEVDHIHPHARGGAHELSNFQTLCGTCNRSKGAKITA